MRVIRVRVTIGGIPPDVLQDRESCLDSVTEIHLDARGRIMASHQLIGCARVGHDSPQGGARADLFRSPNQQPQDHSPIHSGEKYSEGGDPGHARHIEIAFHALTLYGVVRDPINF